MRIDVWSDIACPWCWLGKHHLEEALRRRGIEDVEVEFRSFELQPDARETRPIREYLMELYGHDLSDGHQHLEQAGSAVGIEYDFDKALMANTFDAHRLHHFAKTKDLGAELMERLMRARQGEGADVADHATLKRLATEVGLDEAEVDEVLSGGAFADDVRADEALAHRYGIHGVPFFVIDGKYGVSGAQPVEGFERAFAMAEAATPPPS